MHCHSEVHKCFRTANEAQGGLLRGLAQAGRSVSTRSRTEVDGTCCRRTVCADSASRTLPRHDDSRTASRRRDLDPIDDLVRAGHVQGERLSHLFEVIAADASLQDQHSSLILGSDLVELPISARLERGVHQIGPRDDATCCAVCHGRVVQDSKRSGEQGVMGRRAETWPDFLSRGRPIPGRTTIAAALPTGPAARQPAGLSEVAQASRAPSRVVKLPAPGRNAVPRRP
jgi:hypothetical protein